MRIPAFTILLFVASGIVQAQRMNRSPTHTEYGFLKQNVTVLFQGDSITDGGRARIGSDLNHIMGQDYGYIVAAEVGVEVAERNVHFLNRGVSGERVVDLAARWQQDTLALKPDVLSILVGVNDTVGSRGALTAEEYEASYDKLLAATVAALPQTKIVLGEPFLLPVGKHLANYAAEMTELKKKQAVVAKLGAKYHLPVIHYQQIFNDAVNRAPAEHWCWDGVHPTYAGHGLMAHAWLRVTSEAWGGN
jgi:lysophospholipase L1-like esterase